VRSWIWLAALAACGSPRAAAPGAPGAPVRSEVVSNILRGDYAGSRACADCHGAIYTAWEASAMRGMTRDAHGAAIRAPFDGASLRIGGDTVTIAMRGGERVMELVTPQRRETFRVTKVIGGRYREDFVGLDARGEEHVLPATFVFSTRSWRYKGYSVMVKERPAMSARGRWSQECIACHNTLPLATMLYDELFGPGLPSYQGKLSDRLIPKQRAWTATLRDDDGFAHVLADEIRYLGADPPTTSSVRALLPAAAKVSESKLDGAHLVELGIGCEACHNGARAHAANEKVMPAFEARTRLFGVDPPRGQDGSRAQWINHTCAKCHTVLFSRYPWTWEGGERNKDPGGSTTNSGEGRDFQLGGCSSKMACTACHDPHAVDPAEQLAKLATPAGNSVCASCHATIASDVAAHSHHKAGGAGTSCIACHMAKKNMGLDYSLVRYHRIGSPTDQKRVLRDRPLECALCHADRSVESLVSTMETWWGKRYDRAPLQALYGDDLGANALYATIARGKPHEQAAAMATLGQARDRAAVPAITGQLAHEYPLVRYFAHRALETITGAPVAIDVGAAAPEVRTAADAWLRQHP
jgi:predicted CXXCH cytochrome family protein